MTHYRRESYYVNAVRRRGAVARYRPLLHSLGLLAIILLAAGLSGAWQA